MTTENSVGAAPDTAMDWQAINWRQVHQNVRRLQIRIVKATEEGRWGKVKALQHLLTRSFSGRALAVRRVTQNQGKRTPGVDGVVWDSSKKKIEAVLTLRQRGYQTLPCDESIFPRTTEEVGGRSQFHACGTGRCKRCTCWRSTQSRRPRPIRTHTDFGNGAQRPMR